IQELTGGGKKEEKNSLTDMVAAVKDLREMAAGEGKELPEWMRDPVAFSRTIQELTGGGKKEVETKSSLTDMISVVKELRSMTAEGKELPEWMRDPVAFQRTVQELTPKGEGGALEEIRAELGRVREDLHQTELKHKDEQITQMGSAIQGYRSEVSQIRSEMEQNRQVVGRSAYDLIGDLVKKVPDKDDIRQMVLEAVGKVPKLEPRSPAERGRVLEGMAGNIEMAAEVQAVEDMWFKWE
ncbi:unnamed protein product, partial [marine sediment metagenome]